MKIVILDAHAVNPGDLDWNILSSFGDLIVYPHTLPEETFDRINDAEIVLTNKTIISKEIIESCPNLKYVGVLATGYNVVDLDAATKNGIVVTNIPGYGTMAVAQFVFALLLEICCRVQLHSDDVHAGGWISSRDFCYWKTPQIELEGKTFGIFGFGSIGQAVANIALSFGMKVICYTRSPEKLLENSKVEKVSLEDLFSQSDIISLHSPLTKDTENLINEKTIDKMKNDVIILNTARGPIVNESDMRNALENKKVGFYAADVISYEPMLSDNPLLNAPNCIITPHIAWATKEARTRLLNIAVENIKSFIQGSPINKVNK